MLGGSPFFTCGRGAASRGLVGVGEAAALLAAWTASPASLPPRPPPHVPRPRCPAAARRSVPSGRVGNSKDAIFRSNEHFREAVAEREALVREDGRRWCVADAGDVVLGIDRQAELALAQLDLPPPLSAHASPGRRTWRSWRRGWGASWRRRSARASAWASCAASWSTCCSAGAAGHLGGSPVLAALLLGDVLRVWPAERCRRRLQPCCNAALPFRPTCLPGLPLLPPAPATWRTCPPSCPCWRRSTATPAGAWRRRKWS